MTRKEDPSPLVDDTLEGGCPGSNSKSMVNTVCLHLSVPVM